MHESVRLGPRRWPLLLLIDSGTNFLHACLVFLVANRLLKLGLVNAELALLVCHLAKVIEFRQQVFVAPFSHGRAFTSLLPLLSVGLRVVKARDDPILPQIAIRTLLVLLGVTVVVS